MSNRIRIARGSQAHLPSDLMYGEFYWQKVAAGTSDGVLYMGTPDGSTAGALAVGGARAMKSWYYKGVWSTVGVFPSNPTMGDMYLIGANGAGNSVFQAGDMMIYDGTSSWLRINNVGGAASQTAYDPAISGLEATTTQDAIDSLALNRFQYGGLFSAASGSYPASPKPGQFYISADIGTVAGASYAKGDGAFWNGSAWTKIPFSQAFPADGIQGDGTTNKLSKFDAAHHIVDSNVSDSGTEVAIGVNTKVTGSLQANQLKVGDGVAEQVTISVPAGIGNIAVDLPSTAGTLMLTSDELPASQVTYNHTGTSLVSSDVQAALTEMAKGKMQYAGSVSKTSDIPSSNGVVGGLYLITAAFAFAGEAGPFPMDTEFKKGDWIFYDGAAWTQIPAGYTDALNTAFDNTGVTLGDGSTAVTVDNVQAALADLYGHKADLDANGKVLASQLPSSIVGALQYRGTYDVSATSALPSDTVVGHYFVITGADAPKTMTGGLVVTSGDWVVRDASGWEVVQGGNAVDAIKVGAGILQGQVEFQGTAPITVTAAAGVVTIAANAASKSAQGVVKVGDGLSVDANGLVAVDATNGLHLGASGKLETYLNTNGLEIDANQMLGIKASANFTFAAGALDLSNTTVVAGTYPKVTVDAKGRVTGGAALLVSDVPVYVSGDTGANVELYNATNGKVAGLKVVGPVSVAKTGDLVTLDFTQTNATALSAKFASDAETVVAWNTRATGTDTISSIVGAVNANREDLSAYIAYLNAQGANAGSLLIGAKGITGVTPTGGALAGSASLQAMLEGLKDYTDSAIQAFDLQGVVEVGTTGTTNRMAKFTGADKIGDSSISDTGSAVTIDVPVQVTGNLTVAKVGAASSALIMQVGGTTYQTTVKASTASNNLALELPSATGVSAGTILADFSIIDCGDYDA